MSKNAILIAGSPQTRSRSSQVLAALGEQLAASNVAVRGYTLADFEPDDLVGARGEAPLVQRYLAEVRAASALVLATPVYKATYAGGLKLLVDLIPPDALRGKTLLAVATARIERHFASVGRAFDDLFQFFEVGSVVPPVFLLDEHVRLEGDTVTYEPAALQALERAGRELSAAIARPGAGAVSEKASTGR